MKVIGRNFRRSGGGLTSITISLISYLRDNCHKQALLIFESHGDSNRCISCRGNRPTRHTYPMLSPHIVPDHTYLTRSMHNNLSRSRQQSWTGSLLLRKSAPDTIHNTTSDRSAGPYPVFLSSQPIKQWGKSQPSVDSRLIGLSGSYHRHAIGKFNTYSHRPIH
jgi:hypothetical protein